MDVASMTGSVGFNPYPRGYAVPRDLPKVRKRRRVEPIVSTGQLAGDDYDVFVAEIDAIRNCKRLRGIHHAFARSVFIFCTRGREVWMTDRQWHHFNRLRYLVRSLEREEACNWTAEEW